MTLVISFLLALFALVEPKATANEKNAQFCSVNQRDVNGLIIGAVIDQSSRVGKEQKIAVKMAVHDFNRRSQCSKLALHFQDSQGNLAQAVSAVADLVTKKKAHTILGQLTLEEAILLWDFDKISKDIPIVSTSPISTTPPLLPSQHPSFISMSTDITFQMQLIAAIVGHFKWQKVIAIYEYSTKFSTDSGLIDHLSSSLRAVHSVVEHHLAFLPVGSVSKPKASVYIEEELRKVKNKNIMVFIVLQSSLDFALILFDKAKQLGMMEKGYVWIVLNDIASLFDSIEPSIILKDMQGLIGLKTNCLTTTNSFRVFEQRFKRNYRSQYSREDNFSPSLYALRAYDATWAIANGIKNSQRNVSLSVLAKSILSSNFKGLTGKIRFKNGGLLQKPVYQVVNVIGRSYRIVSIWSPEELGFSGNLGESGSIYWPGGEWRIPKGWTLGSIEKPLRIGVPADGAFHQFVNVSFEQSRNETTFSGFSIEVFEAAVKLLPYHLSYELVPHYGTYDDIVVEVHNKSLDAAIGDIGITANRYQIVEFSQPYLETGIVMVVTVKPDVTNTRLMILKAFQFKMWMLLAALSIFTGVVIWLNEYANNNTEFLGTFSQNIGSILWFSVTILSFAQRENIKSNLSRLVLATWLFVILAVTTCFTAVVTSMMTVPKIVPSVMDIAYLIGTGAPVGCNGNSFIYRFLIDVLHFKPENIRRIGSDADYPIAFQSGDIKAAFLITAHAKIFLNEYCNGYTIAGPSFEVGGIGFVFQKGYPLAVDISEAILKLKMNGTVNQLEEHKLSFPKCTSSTRGDNQGLDELGVEPFFVLFLISGGLLVIAFLNAVARLLKKRHSSITTLYENH